MQMSEKQQQLLAQYNNLRRLVRQNGLQSLNEEQKELFKNFWDIFDKAK